VPLGQTPTECLHAQATLRPQFLPPDQVKDERPRYLEKLTLQLGLLALLFRVEFSHEILQELIDLTAGQGNLRS
jgi:hypothetical protein